MKKQELIAEYERVSNFVETVKTKSVIDKLKQIDEPKVQVPEFVADWIFKAQLIDRRSIRSALETATIRLYAKRSDEVIAWLKDISNQDIFASAWANDYEVEKEPKYTVKFKATKQYLSNDELGPHFDPSFRSNFTKSDLEKLGLGWVFDCEGMEVEKVGK
jgi:hypothetical protein|nr:MAG TPA: Protein of unknown function (DUF1642) [Caudoviricetes sp.]DAY11562.1 MAG TPA: Protein of unknown function (DUF1642) [Caudoviricetes sp.]